MEKTPTLVGTGFPVTFMARSILRLELAPRISRVGLSHAGSQLGSQGERVREDGWRPKVESAS